MNILLRRLTGKRNTLIGAALVALILMFAPVNAAAAAQTPTPASVTAAGGAVEANWTIPDIGSPPSESEANKAASNVIENTPNRTLNRWGDAANGFHTKFDGFVGTQLAEMAQRNMLQGGAMAGANSAMKWMSGYTQFAASLNVIDGMGSAMDGIVKTMLGALIGTAGNVGTAVLLGLIGMLCVMIAIWRNARAGMARMAREVGAVVVIIAIVFGVGVSALNHNPGQDGYNPSPLSPGWLVKGVNDSITTLTAAPAKAFVDSVETAVWGEEPGVDLSNGLGCSAYTQAMKTAFDDAVATGTSSTKSMKTIAQVTDSMWDSTGLYVWTKTQAGYDNPYAAKVYCRILDFRDAAPGTAAYTTWVAAANTYRSAAGTAMSNNIRNDAPVRAAFAPSGSADTMASIVAWAACKPTGFSGGRFHWQWEKGWQGFRGGIEHAGRMDGYEMTASNADSECQKWWDAAAGDDIPDIFDVKGEGGWISDRSAAAAEADDVRDFLTAVTGVNPWGGFTGVMSYAAGAYLTLGAFLVIDTIVVVAKLFAAMFILSLWFVLIGAMFRPSEMKDRLAKTFNKFLGTAVFAALTTLILTFVIVFARALIRVGIDLWGAGSIMSMLWSGLAPVLALVLVHVMFTKVFKLPSPVSLRGAQAWGKAGMSGAVGNAVGAGVGSYMGSRLGTMAKGAAKAAGSGMLNKVSGGRIGRPVGARSQMQPAGAKTTAESIAARVDAGEKLTAKEQKLLDKTTAAEEFEKTKREWQLAAETEQAGKKIARQEERDAKRADRADLRSARREFRAEHGVAAPGDLAGALAVAASGVVTAVRDRAGQATSTVAAKTGVTAVSGELARRRAVRRDAVAARKADAATRRAMRGQVTGRSAVQAGSALSATSAAMGTAAGAATRAGWGVTTSAFGPAADAARKAAAGAAGSAAAQMVSMMGGAGAAAALAAAAGASRRRDVGARPVVGQEAPAVAVVPETPVTEVAVTPISVDVSVQLPMPNGAGAVKITPAHVHAPSLPVGAVRRTPPARNIPVAQAREQASAAVKRVAAAVDGPAAASHAVRQQAWKTADAGRAKVTEVANSKRVVGARADAAIVRGMVRNGADTVRQSDLFRDSEAVAKRTAQVVAKSAQAAVEGARLVAERKQNNAEVLAQYRARRDAAAQASTPAVRMEGDGGNTPATPKAIKES